MRAVVVAVDARAAGLETLGDVAMCRRDEVLGHDPARNARLVRDHDHREVCPIELPYGVDREGEEHEAIEAIEVAGLLDQSTVAIDEDGASAHETQCIPPQRAAAPHQPIESANDAAPPAA